MYLTLELAWSAMGFVVMFTTAIVVGAVLQTEIPSDLVVANLLDIYGESFDIAIVASLLLAVIHLLNMMYVCAMLQSFQRPPCLMCCDRGIHEAKELILRRWPYMRKENHERWIKQKAAGGRLPHYPPGTSEWGEVAGGTGEEDSAKLRRSAPMRQSDTVRKANTTVTSYIRGMEEATIQSVDGIMSMADGVYKILPITVNKLPDWEVCETGTQTQLGLAPSRQGWSWNLFGDAGSSISVVQVDVTNNPNQSYHDENQTGGGGDYSFEPSKSRATTGAEMGDSSAVGGERKRLRDNSSTSSESSVTTETETTTTSTTTATTTSSDTRPRPARS